MRASTPLRRAFAVGVFVSFVNTLLPQATAPPFPNRDGLLRIDVAVSEKSGNPVRELLPTDFTLLDNGRPTRIFTVQWSPAKDLQPESLPELIFVFDDETHSAGQADNVKQQLGRYFRQNAGVLSYSVIFYRISHEGVFASAKPWVDGNLAATELERSSEPRLVSVGRENLSTLLMNDHFNEVGTLGLIAIDQRSLPGRKMLVWFGDASSQIGQQNSITHFDPWTRIGDRTCGHKPGIEFSTWLREARITVNVLSMDKDAEPRAFDQDFLAAVAKSRAYQDTFLSISALAAYTGGQVYASWKAIQRDLERPAAGTQAFYTLTFDPPRTEQTDEYHPIAVALSDPNLKTRTLAGYFNQPVYFDHPRSNLEYITVAQLDVLIRHKPPDLLRRFDNIRLTERLFEDHRSQLLSMLHNDRERQAVMILADLSEFEPSPPAEIAADPFPGHDAAQAILKRALEYEGKSASLLPDFFATRTETEYQEPKIRDKDSCNLPVTEQPLRVATTTRGTVQYRNGVEVIEVEKSRRKRIINVRNHALNTRGTFGPALASILSGLSNPLSSITWSRWEQSSRGKLAVFHFFIPPNVPAFEVTYCCLPVGDGTTLYRNKAAYRGELAVDAESAAVMRLVIEADLDEDRDPRAPLIRSQLMIEYAPFQIGGKRYTLPLRSVSISRGRTLKFEWRYSTSFLTYGPYETLVSEFTFTNYHKFGSESRILTGFDDLPQPTTPESTKTSPAAQPN